MGWDAEQCRTMIDGCEIDGNRDRLFRRPVRLRDVFIYGKLNWKTQAEGLRQKQLSLLP